MAYAPTEVLLVLYSFIRAKVELYHGLFLYAFISFTFQGWIRYWSFCSGRTPGTLVKTIIYSKFRIILVIPVCNLTLHRWRLTLPYLTLPYLTLCLTLSYILPYLRSYLTPYFTLPYRLPTLPYILPYLSLHVTLPYLTNITSYLTSYLTIPYVLPYLTIHLT